MLSKFIPRLHPELDWVQVAVSSHCDANCTYCPRTRFRSAWKSRHMDPDLFARFIDRLKNTTLVYLQGWGEPFVHPHFWELLHRVKKRGFMAGCTSNANNLDKETLKRAVGEGLDILALSLAGVGEENDRIRHGTSFDRVMRTIEEVQRIRAKQGTAAPQIHLAYMVLRSRLADLEKLPRLVLDSGVDHTVLSSLTLPLSRRWEKEALLADSHQGYDTLLQWMQELFSSPKLGSRVFPHIYSPYQPLGACSENVHRAFCLSETGRVSPCVIAQIPTTKPAAYWYQGQEYFAESADFGSLTEQGLKDIWYSRKYRRFRRKMDLAMCSHCHKTRIVSDPNFRLKI
ncbi:MAG: radical SAM/SPASM domain-containing protein [Desulfonatronovibrionaceae bacterium]